MDLGSGVAVSWGVGRRRGSDPVLLRFQHTEELHTPPKKKPKKKKKRKKGEREAVETEFKSLHAGVRWPCSHM